MTKEFNYSVIILLVVLLGLLLRLPLEMVINNFSDNAVFNELLSGVMIKIILIGGLCYFMIKKDALPFIGFAPSFTLTNIWLLMIPVLALAAIAFTHLETYKQTTASILLLFGLNAATTGGLEELSVRGMILPLMLRHFSKKKHPFFSAIFVSSLLFGLAHFVALVRQPDNFSGILSQVIFAIGIGFFLATLFLSTQNIISPIIVHFLINSSGGLYKLKEEAPDEAPVSEAMHLSDFIPVLVLSTILIFIGVLLLREIDKEKWLEKAALIKI